ncbi:STAS domain-containing protein [Streptomyces termitum]|uniref:STAS domain-containing protein n=1 Tax=Streptomyces termitum TaxID=67368 RepID=UPI00379C9E1B
MTTIEAHEDHHGAWTVLRLSGELDLMTSPRIRRRVHDAVAAGRHDLVVDLSDVLFCDSTGVGVLVAARRLLRSCGGRLRLVLPPEPGRGTGDGRGHVTRVFSALGVVRLFDVYEDVPAALEAGAPVPVPPPASVPPRAPSPPPAVVSPRRPGSRTAP